MVDFYAYEKGLRNYFWHDAKDYLLRQLILRHFRGSRRYGLLTVLNVGWSSKRLMGRGGITEVNLDRDPNLRLKVPQQQYVIGDIVDYPQLLDPNEYPQLPKRFDCIVLSDVIEHMRGSSIVEDALENCWKLLNPGGIIIVTVPACSNWYTQHDRDWGHRKRYDYRDFCTALIPYAIRRCHPGVEIFRWNLILSPLMFLSRKLGVGGYKKTPLNPFLKLLLMFETWLILHGLKIKCFGGSLVGVLRKCSID